MRPSPPARYRFETRKFCELVAEPFGPETVIAPFRALVGTVASIRVSLTTAKTAEAPPPNVTETIPVSPVPVIATELPTLPDVGEIDVIVGPAGAVVTVNPFALVAVPAEFVTEIRPEVAPDGTGAVSCESEPAVNDAAVPLNFTDVALLSPEPVTVTDVPTGPDVGVNELIVGATTTAVTEKLPELVPVPFAVVTEIGPVVAPDGTFAVNCVSVPGVNDAAVPLNFTDVAPVKPVPLTVTDVPG